MLGWISPLASDTTSLKTRSACSLEMTMLPLVDLDCLTMQVSMGSAGSALVSETAAIAALALWPPGIMTRTFEVPMGGSQSCHSSTRGLPLACVIPPTKLNGIPLKVTIWQESLSSTNCAATRSNRPAASIG